MLQKKQSSAIFVGLAIGLDLMFATLYSVHLPPSGSYQHGMGSAAIAGIFLLLFFLRQKALPITLASVSYLLLFLLIAIQPNLHAGYKYRDALIYPMGAFLLAFCIHNAIKSMDKTGQKTALDWIIALLLFAATLTSLTQHLQWLLPAGSLPDWLLFPLQAGSTPNGNVAQRNQAAFINVLGIVCLYYHTASHSFVSHKFFAFLKYPLAFLLASGTALSCSRGGLLLAIIALAVLIVREVIVKQNKKNIILISAIFIAGYAAGMWLLEWNPNATHVQNALQRATVSNYYLRMALQEQAFAMFASRPLTGWGLESFAAYGLENFATLKWYEHANHSHFFLSMLAAELGVLGFLALLPLAYVFATIIINLKSVFASAQKTSVFAMLLVILAYSCSEYPLWYVHYFMLFAALLAFAAEQEKTITTLPRLGIFSAAFCLVCCVFSVASFVAFTDISEMSTSFAADKSAKAQKMEKINFIYGQQKYQEMLLFMHTPTNTEHLHEKIQLGERVLSAFSSTGALQKQGVLLAFDGQQEKSLALFKAACKWHSGSECENVKTSAKNLLERHPEYFSHLKNFSEYQAN